MTTLFKATATHYEGQKRMGVCNSYCYNAKHPQCMCCCGGVNHGVGLQKAIENTRELKSQGKQDVVFNEKTLE